VLSFAVSQRTRKFCVRLVLGANRATIFRFVQLRGVRQIAVGVACGIALAVPAVLAFAHLVKRSPSLSQLRRIWRTASRRPCSLSFPLRACICRPCELPKSIPVKTLRSE
jgi:hypothetical protein